MPKAGLWGIVFFVLFWLFKGKMQTGAQMALLFLLLASFGLAINWLVTRAKVVKQQID